MISHHRYIPHWNVIYSETSDVARDQASKLLLRIPVMWAGNSGDVGRRRSEATLVAFYSSQVAHMSQEQGKFSVH
jgi:hypothetical protein